MIVKWYEYKEPLPTVDRKTVEEIVRFASRHDYPCLMVNQMDDYQERHLIGHPRKVSEIPFHGGWVISCGKKWETERSYVYLENLVDIKVYYRGKFLTVDECKEAGRKWIITGKS